MKEMKSGVRVEDLQSVLLDVPESAAKGKAEDPAGAEEAEARVRLRQPQRHQMEMVVQCPDDLVAPDHPVRMVTTVVERLDVEEFCKPIKAREGEVGRDATDPRLLIALWLYACMRGIGSARELARRCQESAPFRWLCGGVSVNHRMLSEFRTEHGKALDGLLTQVIALLVEQGLVKVSRVSQDGVRVRVGAGAGRFRGGKRVEKVGEGKRPHQWGLRSELHAPGHLDGG